MDIKRELADIRNSLLPLDLKDTDELSTTQVSLQQEIFDCSLRIKRLAHHPANTPSLPPDRKGVILSKFDVPTFDGNILQWRSFWKQFCVFVHDRSNLSDSEKCIYLQHSLKNSPAKKIIESLSRSGEYYAEAVECLKSRYDCPRLIHETLVCVIIEALPLKDGI